MDNAKPMDGVDSKEVVRQGLIDMRNRLMNNWPDTINDTVLLSHAIAWLYDEEA